MPRNKHEREIRRLYVPFEDPWSSSIPRSELVSYNTDMMISQLRMVDMCGPEPVPDYSSLVVFIDARASYGIYFGPDSPYNSCGLLDKSLPQTSTRAEIEAFRQALGSILAIIRKYPKLSRIKVATDSSFLVKAMSQWIKRWIENNGVGSNGRQVAHFQVLKRLHDRLVYLENNDQTGRREYQSWHVPRTMNREADALANKALDEA
ncbi:hypothetical protein J4E86_009104 [Alternaria arbusti]|uniref:uncharacterized protein n=1 Tax=Alternaria arbusti TaxID=232088 RepID=UPI00221FEDFB|nr:uncharacterized protein J4E86_009104 [Alternaria arbusti]KAI4946399.1 hypothetical protein J4E86_009104 [Alternaria arbusti]